MKTMAVVLDAPVDTRQHQHAQQQKRQISHTDDGEPFGIEPDRSDCDETGPKPSADIGRGNGKRRHHQRSGDPQQKVVSLPHGGVSRCLAFGHDPVFTASPPNLRSRLAYSAIAPSSAALSKSGQ